MKLRYLSFWVLTLLSLISCSRKTAPSASNLELGYFQYGVASGDPTNSSVILWTAVNASDSNKKSIEWAISLSADMSSTLQSGTVDMVSSNTIKTKVSGLDDGIQYYYQFTYNGEKSPIGRTKTISSSKEQLKIGIVSCSNFEAGYFNAYESLSQKDVDFVVHLGDYIYEYGPGTYGDTTLQRQHVPNREILSLDDYRMRYAQYREDPALQLVHQQHPFIHIWDDHEIVNNAYQTGAQNHQPDEGDYILRADIAKQVYHEWLPTDLDKNDNLYRTFSSGNFADLIMLDGRIAGRSQQLDAGGKESASHSMLGSEQLQWLKQNLKESKARWKIIGNQVIFSPTNMARISQREYNMDAWDGYSAERDNIIQFLDGEDISNVVILTGDTHMSWAFEVPISESRLTYKSVALEIGTPSITSSNLNESSPSEDVIFGERVLKASNPHLKYVDGRNHGYAILTLEKEVAYVDWYHVSNLKSREYTERKAKRYYFNANGGNKFY